MLGSLGKVFVCSASQRQIGGLYTQPGGLALAAGDFSAYTEHHGRRRDSLASRRTHVSARPQMYYILIGTVLERQQQLE
jgi:hypothetical protein